MDEWKGYFHITITSTYFTRIFYKSSLLLLSWKKKYVFSKNRWKPMRMPLARMAHGPLSCGDRAASVVSYTCIITHLPAGVRRSPGRSPDHCGPCTDTCPCRGGWLRRLLEPAGLTTWLSRFHRRVGPRRSETTGSCPRGNLTPCNWKSHSPRSWLPRNWINLILIRSVCVGGGGGRHGRGLCGELEMGREVFLTYNCESETKKMISNLFHNTMYKLKLILVDSKR